MAAQPELQPPEPITPADVVFTEATPHQRVLSWELNGASWAPPMTIEQYVGRETTLSQTALSANGGTKYFILHPKTDPETIVSACEVTTKRAVVASSNEVREVAAYSIASVFTNPRFREQGMAGYMLRQVQAAVDSTAECGALYSDIGRKYYTRLGWKDFRSPQVLLHFAGEGQEFTAPEGVSLLKSEDVPQLCERDVAAVKARFQRYAESGDGKTHVAFLPTAEQLAWHFARDKYVCQTLLGREVVYRGAKTADGNAWIYWDHDLREKKLKVLRIVTGEGDGEEKRRGDVRALVLAALVEAKDWGLHKVLVWEPSVDVAAVATDLWRDLGPGLEVVFDEREDGSIPSLRWKQGKSLDAVVWEDDEYYAWC
ncbi:hypothetical protein NEMBOFW57_003671 [Staphylotrichum longicolle]|uniref:LYC1 C-terminal domain-containing protein n=1 Tax=Staphylotrichum longicolle TaxID=669026 RepID=A0AAD4F8A8_9PEZI|nr:hypothetical protein NEMBOFW57_003671 [Staphylotrichum longicolle]